MFKFNSEPMDKQTILENSFELYKQTFSLSLPYSVAIACLTSLPLLLVLSPLWPRMELIISVNLCGILAFILSGALLFHLYSYCNGVPCNFLSALKHALIKFPILLLLVTVYVIIVLSGTMLLILPGIILAFSLMFSFTLALTDNMPMLQTLIKSHRLVWGNWWHSFLIISLPLLLNIVLSGVCFITVAEVATNLKLSLLATGMILTLLNILLQTFFIPLILDVILVLLHDLRQRTALRTPPWN